MKLPAFTHATAQIKLRDSLHLSETFELVLEWSHDAKNDSMVLTTRTKVGMIRQNYNSIDGINSSAEAKRFTYETMQRNIIMSILRQCKK